MIVKEKVTEKEKSVKSLLERLRNQLNKQSVDFTNNPNSWAYITSLTHTENKLTELVEYLEATPKG